MSQLKSEKLTEDYKPYVFFINEFITNTLYNSLIIRDTIKKFLSKGKSYIIWMYTKVDDSSLYIDLEGHGSGNQCYLDLPDTLKAFLEYYIIWSWKKLR
jgi:hypothetical protein